MSSTYTTNQLYKVHYNLIWYWSSEDLTVINIFIFSLLLILGFLSVFFLKDKGTRSCTMERQGIYTKEHDLNWRDIVIWGFSNEVYYRCSILLSNSHRNWWCLMGKAGRVVSRCVIYCLYFCFTLYPKSRGIILGVSTITWGQCTLGVIRI